MDLTATPTHTTSNTTTNTASTKSPEPEPEPDTPTRIQTLAKPISFSNGVLKRHHHHPPPPPPPPAVSYRECLKNHAASLGGHALDGCGEFMPSPAATPADPTSIKCAACGCHRNFHRRDPDDFPHPAAAPSTQVIEYQPHHRHLPPPPHPPPPRSPDSASPPPISSSYYGHPVHPHHHRHHHHHSTAPHVLIALSTAAAPEGSHPPAAAMVSPISRKRFRTKFTLVQKERMLEFAERVGWKIQKRDEDIIQELCHEIGVERGVLKVWMHNNKNRSSAGNNININSTNDTNINSCAATENYDIPTSSQQMKDGANGGGDHHDHHHHQNHDHHHVGTNGSSSP